MSKNYNDLLKLNDEILRDNIILDKEKRKVFHTINRTIDICENNQQIVNEIENDFLKKTKLQEQDIPFLFLAIALQTLRWILLPSLDLEFCQISKENRLNAMIIRKVVH